MSAKDIFNSVGKSVSGLFKSSPITYVRQPDPIPKYTLPKVISPKHEKLFVEQAQLAGVNPDEFGMIAKREQGVNTTPERASLRGLVDPTDRGVMQVNKMHEPYVRQRFQQEFGRMYYPDDARDSIIAARMVLQENKRQLDQMIKNGTFAGGYTNRDLIDSYNLGATGLIKAKQGDAAKSKRLERYQKAGLEDIKG